MGSVETFPVRPENCSRISTRNSLHFPFFAKNLTQDPHNDFGIVDVFDATLDWSIGPPRTWGVEVNFRY